MANYQIVYRAERGNGRQPVVVRKVSDRKVTAYAEPGNIFSELVEVDAPDQYQVGELLPYGTGVVYYYDDTLESAITHAEQQASLSR